MIKEKITKEYIIEYLKEYYEKYKIAPRATREHPFCKETVLNKFGCWNNALIEASINQKISEFILQKQALNSLLKNIKDLNEMITNNNNANVIHSIQ